jgi:putative tricarboxylic transport membrane protein
MSERIFLSILICCGAVFLYFGIKIDAPFAYGPIGPKAFPLFLGIAFVVLCALCLWRGGTGGLMLKGRVVTIAAILLFYLITFRFLGFMFSTTIGVYAAARAVGSTWMQGLLTGLIISIFFYGVFHFFLQVPLPLGYIFKVIG